MSAGEPTVSHSSASGRSHQRVSWLELFYDLVFVAVIANVTGLLIGDPDLKTIVAVAGLSIVVWLTWFSVTFITNLGGGLGSTERLVIFASMAGVGVMALGVEDLAHGNVWLFLIGMTIARLATWPVWARSFGNRFIRATGVPGFMSLWLLSGLLPSPWIWVAWVVIAAMDFATLVLLPRGDGGRQFASDHLIERTGLFIMLVFGEAVIQIIHSVDHGRTTGQWVTGALALALVCAVWWLVYDSSITGMERVIEEGGGNAFDFVGLSQVTVIVGLILLSAGIADAIAASAGGDHGVAFALGGRLTLGLGLSITLAGVAGLNFRVVRARFGRVMVRGMRPLLTLVVICVPTGITVLLGGVWAPAVLVGVLFALYALIASVVPRWLRN